MKNFISRKDFLIFAALSIILIFSSCKPSSFRLKTKIIQNDGTSVSDLWFVEFCQNIYGIDIEAIPNINNKNICDYWSDRKRNIFGILETAEL